MTNPLDLFSEYNAKALKTLNALNDLNVSAVDTFVNKQVELTNSLLDAGLASSKEFSAVKTPAEAVEVSSKLAESVATNLTVFVKDSSASTLATGESLKAVLDESLALNKEYAGKVFASGAEPVKKTRKKKAA